MRERLRGLAESTGVLDVYHLRRRVTSLEEAMPEHLELQSRLARKVDELEAMLAQVLERRR